jgi:26S proteasome regulatory subunit (ATPase 3-interacting protein)
MADTVLQHINAQNRPFNAQNVADALGRHGIKKGLAQKYLDQLAESGKICVKESGKQRVFYATQDGIPMDPAQTEAMEADIKTKTAALADAKSELQKKHATLRRLAKTLTVPQMRLKTDALAKQNDALEAKLKPLRASKGEDVSPETLRKTEDAFISSVEQWSSRRRKFTDAFDTVLESVGAPRKKMADDLGVEFDPEPVAARLAELRKLVDAIKRKRAVEARKKKFKANHA